MLKKKWNLLNVYEAAHDENRREFLSELARYCNQNHDPFMVGGDFNLVRFSSKKTKATSTDIPLFSMLSLTVKNCLISKWWGVNIPGQIIRPPTLERLDRCLVSKEWESLFPTAFLQKLPRELSDHNPLIMSSAVNLPLRNLTFRFETSWYKQPEFIDKVKTIWLKPCHANSAVDKVQSKLKRFKQYFKRWGFNVQG